MLGLTWMIPPPPPPPPKSNPSCSDMVEILEKFLLISLNHNT
ncbi:unnamed protein product [Brassica rapa subsp. trilocularis]